MTRAEKYDRVIIGLISGFILPFVVGITIFLFSHGHKTISYYLSEIAQSNIITHAITLCVFPNIVIFLIFNRFDMLRASKGVLAITIAWALVVFGVKFL
jgi:hypothetical protein